MTNTLQNKILAVTFLLVLALLTPMASASEAFNDSKTAVLNCIPESPFAPGIMLLSQWKVEELDISQVPIEATTYSQHLYVAKGSLSWWTKSGDSLQMQPNYFVLGASISVTKFQMKAERIKLEAQSPTGESLVIEGPSDSTTWKPFFVRINQKKFTPKCKWVD